MKKYHYISLIFLLCVSTISLAQVGIGTKTPHSSAQIEVVSSSKGALFPRMNESQRQAIPTPATGLLVYQTDAASGFYYFDGSQWLRLSTSSEPVGSIVAFAGDTSNIPDGWLLCDGSSISQSSYPELFGAIGMVWGGSGTDFNLPDLRGRFLRGTDLGAGNDADASSRTPSNSGGNTGDAVGTVQDENFKSHSHAINDPGHDHDYNNSGTFNRLLRYSGANTSDDEDLSANEPDVTSIGSPLDILNSATGISILNSGGSETRPVNAAVNFIIKY